MPRVYSIEDGNLSSSIVVARTRKYSDLEFSFVNNPTNPAGPNSQNVKTDIQKLTDAAAVKQSIRNILLTGKGEKPFMPMFGTNLNFLLFELDTEFDEDLLQQEIIRTLDVFEPRCEVQKIRTEITPDQHTAKVQVEFKVVNSSELGIVEVDIARIR